MTSQRVYLFELGYSGDLDLKAIAKLINRCQQVIAVDVIEARRSIGEPDIDDIGYSCETLFSHFPPRNPGEVYIGVTVAPLEGNCYTLTPDMDSVIITLYQSQEVSEKASRTKEEYVAHTLVTELLVRHYRPRRSELGRLYHDEVRGCIFDSTPRKSDKEHQLRSGHICTQCAAKLDKANVAASLVSAVTRVLARLQKPSLSRSLTLGLQRPLFSFVLGTLLGGLVINLFSTVLIGQVRDAIVPFIVLLVLAAGLVGWNYVQLRRPPAAG
jgi:hypothetical protein